MQIISQPAKNYEKTHTLKTKTTIIIMMMMMIIKIMLMMIVMMMMMMIVMMITVTGENDKIEHKKIPNSTF